MEINPLVLLALTLSSISYTPGGAAVRPMANSTYCSSLKLKSQDRFAVDDKKPSDGDYEYDGDGGSGLCCEGRQDHCSVPIYDTLCYCDSFCDREKDSDCCPDYWTYCTNKKKPDSNIPPPEELTSSNCVHGGRTYDVDDTVEIGGHTCRCEMKISNNARLLDWSCADRRSDDPLRQLVDEINSADLGWTATDYPQFAGRPIDELIRQKLGTDDPPPSASGMLSLSLYGSSTELPGEFDARRHWPGLVNGALDQGNCGSSWAFSTAGVASDRAAIHSGLNSTIRLSTQQLISCSEKSALNDDDGKQCDRISFDRAWWFVRKNGLVTEECYKHSSADDGQRGRCRLSKIDLHSSTTKCPSSGHRISKIYRSSPPYKIEPNERSIMEEIIVNGPVQALMIARDDFYTYKSGVYRTMLSANEYNDQQELLRRTHSVKIIGWGTDTSTKTPTKYWLCTNSWAENWGEDGNFRIVRGTNESAIETLVVGVWMRQIKRRKHNKIRVYRKLRY